MTGQQHGGGFWSYVPNDDEHESGRITRLRERLEKSIRFHSGKTEFRIFLDSKDVGWGEQWVERLADSVDEALLLFPVITPSYFASTACREEALDFRNRQASLGREDLILPIYYLTAPHIENDEYGTPEEIEIATLLRQHQREDWRALRDTPETDPAYAKAIDRLAQRALEALSRASSLPAGAPPPQSPKPASPGKARQSSGNAPASAESAQTMEVAGSPTDRTEPGLIITLRVNPMPGRADFTTIADAITRAPGGARILVAPGHYRESLVIDKPLELIGDGAREDIIVEAEDATVLTFDTNIGVVRNLTFRQSEKATKYYCLKIKQGRLELEDCDLSSKSLACLAVLSNADPRVRRNQIHSGAESGVFIYDGGKGTYEENEVFGNTFSGIEVSEGAEPVVRRNRIHDGRGSGIYIHNKARGTFEDNEIFGNTLTGIEVKSEADPVVRRNLIYDGRQSGMLIHEKGRGTFEDNEVFGNTLSGIEVKTEAEPIVRRNRIHDGKDSGIYIHKLGRGTFEDNQISGSRDSGIYVGDGGNPTVRGNVITGNEPSGVEIKQGGSGVFEDNELSANGKPWGIDPSAEAQTKRHRNRES